MSDDSTHIKTEFATIEEAEAYERWFRAKVKTALDDKRPAISHEAVMSELRKVIEAKRDNDASGPMES